MNLGDNLSHHKNIQVLSSASATELEGILRSISLPFALLSIYTQGSRHFAWIVPSRPVKVVKKKTSRAKKPVSNTTTEQVK